MQTTNRHAPEFCGCVGHGEPTPHTTHEQCSANRAATVAYLAAVTSSNLDNSIARDAALASKHDSHLVPHYGCPRCPLSSAFVRAVADGEWYVK